MQRKLTHEQLERRIVFATALNDFYPTFADQSLEIAAPGVLANDLDAIEANLFRGPSHGTLALNMDGSFGYTPDAGFFGTDSFLYRASDGTNNSKLAAVTIDVEPLLFGGPPAIAVDDTYTVLEDGSLDTGSSFGVLSNDTGNSLTASVITGPNNGVLSLDADGSFVYAPNADFFGTDSFVYAADDGVFPDEAIVTITVEGVQDATVSANDEGTLDEDTTLVGNVLANDTDVDGDVLTAVLDVGPSNGTLVLNDDGSYEYVPDLNWSGTDAFTYVSSDGTDVSGVAVVEIIVNAVNDSPIAANDFVETDEDTQLVLLSPGVLANDSDIDSAVIVPIVFSGPEHGTLAINDDGSLTYTPDSNWNGTDAFSYQAFDGQLLSDLAVVEILVHSVNDAPVAFNEVLTASGTTPLDVSSIIANDTDVDGDLLAPVLFAGPFNGSLTIEEGIWTYVANEDFVGVDGIVYWAFDGELLSHLAVLTLYVEELDPIVVDAVISEASDDLGFDWINLD